MSSTPVSHTPDQTETAFAGAVMANFQSFTAHGVVASMIYDPALRVMVTAYQQRWDASEPFPANLPDTSFEVVAALYEKAAPVAELPLLAAQIRDRWQRDELKDYIDALLTALVEAQQDAAGITSRAPAQDSAVKLTVMLLDGLAGLRRIVNPVPLYLTKPPSEASTLIYITAGELRTLATALDIQAMALEMPARTIAFQWRAEQLREMAAALPAIPSMLEPAQ